MNYYKNCGETMDQFMNTIKINNKINNRIAYCGRLDPMARGQVLILEGDDCYRVSEYNKKNKIYQVKIIFGISTDSDDALGIIDNLDIGLEKTSSIDETKFIYKNYKFMQKYHYFSTKMLNHRRKNNFNEYSHEVEIYESKIISKKYKIDYKTWKDDIIKNISSIDKTKNFRQKEIINQWNSLDIDYLECVDLELSVSSGFFIRQFVRDMISLVRCPIMCYDIYRSGYF